MSKQALGRIWTILGLFSLSLSLNALLRLQGSEVFLPGPTFEGAKHYSAAVYGLLVTLLPYFFLLRATQIYAKLYRGQTWRSSIPIAFNYEIDPEQKYGETYQRVFFFLFIVAPELFRLLLLRKIFVRGKVYEWGNVDHVVSGLVEHLTKYFPPARSILGNNYLFGHHYDGITYFPFWGSWFLVIVEIGFVLYLLYVIQSILLPGLLPRLSRLIPSSGPR